jgi:hypothetical protein
MIAHSTQSFSFCIAGFPMTLDLTECDESVRLRLVERYGAFAAPTLAPVFSIRVRVESGGEYIPIEVGRNWQIRTLEHDGHIDFTSYYEQGWADRTTGRGELVMRPQGDMENFLRVLFAWLCIDHDGLLIHASGVIWQDKGYVFFGPSGSGKTTLARLSLDRTVLSDDLVIVKKDKGVFRLCGVPFRGDFPEAPRNNASANLRGLFALAKDEANFVVPLSKPEAAARLAACVPFVMTEAAQTLRVMMICAELAEQIGVQMLHFRRDTGFWEVIDGLG